jgi:beta-glucosidase
MVRAIVVWLILDVQKAIASLDSFASLKPPCFLFIGRTYRYYPTSADLPAPLWPFGWGLTYSQFDIAVAPSLAVETTSLPATFKVELKNVGGVASDEVIQVYFAPQFQRQGCPTPKRQLIDFERVHVAAGASTSVTFTVTAKQLELAGIDGSRAPHPGKYTLEFTNGAGTTTTANVTIS